MSQNMKKLFLTAAAVISSAAISACCTTDSTCATNCTQSQNLWQKHSFGQDATREALLNNQAFVNMDEDDSWFGSFGVGFNYMKNRENCDSSSLGSMPFWAADKSNTMTVGTNDGKSDVDGFYLGLGPITTTGSVTLAPKVWEAGVDFSLYAGAHKTDKGFFVKVAAPVSYLSIDPCLTEETPTPVDYKGGILVNAKSDTKKAGPNTTIAAFFKGGADDGSLKKMNYGKIDGKRNSGVKFNDPSLVIGYNLCADDNKHFGLGIRGAAPLATKPCAEYILEPVVGRAHWALGVDVNGSWKCWESDTDDKSVELAMQATIEHLFKSTFKRSFDLKKNGLGSKYIYIAPTKSVAAWTDAHEMYNAINITTVDADSKFAAEVNFSLMANYNYNNWKFGLAYEGWGRSCENLCESTCTTNCSTTITTASTLAKHAVIARQGIWDGADAPAVQAVCDPSAKINKDLSNGGAGGLALSAETLIPSDGLDIDGQKAPSVYTSKLVAHTDYTWADCDYAPFLGANVAYTYNHGNNTAIDSYEIGVRGGLAF